tara:strand:- start:6847 stop:10329 length:3483 start_codon:yes stop_codon:yes gene_type:complete
MAEVRNVFIKSKMNKDLDERLLPSGEYREGRNISISKSEGPDEGVVENILGNIKYSNFNFASKTEIIGTYVDTDKDRIYIFATNFLDSSQDQLSNFPVDDVPHPAGGVIPGSKCYIAYIQGPFNNSTSPAFSILIEGSFLNFSKTHPMLGVDLLEDLLFFTDNRNQPRKINVETAISDSTYYFNEDHISVAKFAPFSPISFLNSSNENTMQDNISEFLPSHSTSVVNALSSSTVNLQFANIDIAISPVTRFININKPELGYFKLTNIDASQKNLTFEYPIGSGITGVNAVTEADLAADRYIESGTASFEAGDVIQFEQINPYYNANFDGDDEYLKNKFVIFSYRFKYDDGEYSLMAPFTQSLFIPKNFGYFLDSGYSGETQRNEKDTADSGIVKFMENQVTSATLKIDLPPRYNIDVASPTAGSLQSNFFNDFKVTEIQILAKESDGLAIKVVDEIIVEDQFTSTTDRYYSYSYQSFKPFKTLPDAVSTRIHDKVPIRAAAQATASNRIIYGNFIENHASPENLNYYLGVGEKKTIGNPAIGSSYSRKEYINHTLKQNRSYKVGVVLVDRYGRSSNVILRDESISLSLAGEKSSIYAPYENLVSTLNWPGNNLKVSFNDIIPISKINGYPGIFNGIHSGSTPLNPLGYLTYKVVVQQLEQEYYNVYVPGATSGKIVFTGEVGDGTLNTPAKPSYKRANNVSNIVLYGDNINKVPKELADVGPTEEIYGSETLLYPRVVTKYIVSPTNWGAPAGGPGVPWAPVLALSQSSQVYQKNEFTVNSIVSFNDLGPWTANRGKYAQKSSYPNNFATNNTVYIDPLYLEASSNPFVAQIETNFLVGFSPDLQNGVSTSIAPNFSKNLNVFETDPVESKIEIYNETTTSGLIKPLNSLISTSAAGGIGVDIATTGANPEPISLTANETIVPSTSAWISPEFQAVDSGNALVSAGTIELVNVTNGNDNVISPVPFELVLTTSPYKYRLRVRSTSPSQYFYWGQNSNDRTFNVTLRILANGNNLVTKTLLLSNNEPTLNPVPSQGSLTWTLGQLGGSITYPIHISSPGPRNIGDPLGTINLSTQAFNGSAGTDLDNLEMVVEKPADSTTDVFFRITQDGNVLTLTTDDDPVVYTNVVKDTPIILKIVAKDAQGISGSGETYYSLKIEITQ